MSSPNAVELAPGGAAASAARGPAAPPRVQAAPWSAGLLREYWFYRELFVFFCWRDIKVRYKQTALGMTWVVLQPVITMVVFTLLFGRLAKLPSDGIPPPIFYYAGLLPWTYFANSFTRSGNSLVTNTQLVTKVYFPRELIPAASVLTHLFDLAICFGLLLGMMAWYGAGFSWELLLWPVLILPLAVFALGLGLWLSALNVKYRDVRHMIPFAVQIGMFVSPVAYSKRLVPEAYQWLYSLNPAVGVIEACRSTIMPDRSVAWGPWAQALAVGLVFVIVGFIYFRRTERWFADVI